MQMTIETFNQRKKELESYYVALFELDEKADHHKNVMEEYPKYFNDEFIKILKANALMMVYNLVESTVLGGIVEIYDKLRIEGVTYSNVRKEIKDIWFSYKFRQVYDQNAHYNSYKAKALEIVNSIISGEIIELDRRAADFSGNLDADLIRRVCNEHGICLTTDKECRGGIVLDTVKEKRNSLAHGTLSFAECGRDYSFHDLMDKKEQTIVFLDGFLAGMVQYYNQKKLLSCTFGFNCSI